MQAVMTRSAPEQTIVPLSHIWLLAEGRAFWESLAGVALWPLLQLAPRGDGHSVLVLPGMAANDASTELMRRYLDSRGLRAHGWEQGNNFGLGAGVHRGIERRLDELFRDSGRKVSIVGWSLGGVYARLLAARHPEKVRDVITMGTPFAGRFRESSAWRMCEILCGHSVDDVRAITRTPAMPTTSIYSRSDGMIDWETSLEAEGPHSENIEVHASHLGLGAHPAVLYALADRLSQPEGQWRPFDRSLLGSMVYPAPAGAAEAPEVAEAVA